MKRTQGFRLVVSLGLIVLGVVALGIDPAQAQTVAPGPYYANPSWDQTLACTTLAACPRFIVLSNMNSDAVLDRETGLVWQRAPTAPTDTLIFSAAKRRCSAATTGGRHGWRLPSLHEMESLIDPSVPLDTLALPPGHPFIGVGTLSAYWTGTSISEDPVDKAYVVIMLGGTTSGTDLKTVSHEIWCVRGGGPIGVY